MKNFDWKGFEENKFLVHCDTIDKAQDFVKECYKRNLTWFNPNNKLISIVFSNLFMISFLSSVIICVKLL